MNIYNILQILYHTWDSIYSDNIYYTLISDSIEKFRKDGLTYIRKKHIRNYKLYVVI